MIGHNTSNPLLFNSEYNILPNDINNDQMNIENESNNNTNMDNNSKYKLKNSFFIKILPICLAVGYVNFNTWGMVTALSPFAFKNVTKNQESASIYLSLAYQLSSVLLVCGDLSTTLFHIPIIVGLLFFTFFTGTIYLVAMNISFFHSPYTAPMLVICFSFGRFFEASLVTTMYRKVATDYSPSERENASRAVGLTDQISTTIGTVISTILVSRYGNC